MLIAALLHSDQKEETTQMSMRKWLCIKKTGNCVILEKTEVHTHTIVWMDLENMLKSRSQEQRMTYPVSVVWLFQDM